MRGRLRALCCAAKEILTDSESVLVRVSSEYFSILPPPLPLAALATRTTTSLAEKQPDSNSNHSKSPPIVYENEDNGSAEGLSWTNNKKIMSSGSKLLRDVEDDDSSSSSDDNDDSNDDNADDEINQLLFRNVSAVIAGNTQNLSAKREDNDLDNNAPVLLKKNRRNGQSQRSSSSRNSSWGSHNSNSGENGRRSRNSGDENLSEGSVDDVWRDVPGENDDALPEATIVFQKDMSSAASSVTSMLRSASENGETSATQSPVLRQNVSVATPVARDIKV